MDAERFYSGESVRCAIRRLYGEHGDNPVQLPHATVPPITPALVQDHANVMDTILKVVREQLASEQIQQEQQQAATTENGRAEITDHWLLSVPAPLRCDASAVVNYLGMLVAIDFCHWAEVLPAHEGQPHKVEEGGLAARPGEEVTGFAGFYTVVETDKRHCSTTQTDDNASSQPPANTLSSSSKQQTNAGSELFAEPTDKAAGQVSSSSQATQEVTLLRGSAAMMYLLRRAVEVHGVPWYDVRFLQAFHGDVDAALTALRVCFVGCEKDGVTPLWMPCTRTRVELLLSLADTFASSATSFFQLLQACEGYMFRPPPQTAAATAGVCGFVPSLVRLHPRYRDFAKEKEKECGGDAVPILKLSQLTALAMEQALPALWRHNGPPASTFSSSSMAPPSWLVSRAATATETGGLFTDRTELSICCDYQIPKTLRAAGLLQYDTHLAYMIDHHVLLQPGSVEEASIRIATLVAANRLLDFVNTHDAALLLGEQGEAASDLSAPALRCDVNHLDYALWYVGRYMVLSEARHHLCRTIMY